MMHDQNPTRRTRSMRGLVFGSLALAALIASGCGDDEPTGPGGPDAVPDGELLLLRPAANAPGLVTLDTSFLAVKGQNAEMRIRYLPVPPDDSGEEFLELRLENETLLRYPTDHPKAGAAFADGDTVVIRIRVDAATLSATFEPSGLQFNPLDPAELEMRYLNADPDYDGDGDDDPDLEDDIDLWRQENPGEPWQRVGTLRDLSLEKVRADLTQFSRYALGI